MKKTCLFQIPFEIPRQQEDEESEPEVVQFRGSQRLRNPNARSGGETTSTVIVS